MNKLPPHSDAAEFWTTRLFCLLLGAALLAAFPEVVLGIHTFFYRDFGALGYPCVLFFRDSLLHGQPPLWNPYSHCGVPYAAQMGAWYFPSWPCAFLPLPWAVNFFMLVHLLFGGAGMFWLARRWDAGSFAAAFAGFAFAFNGVTLSCFLWPNYIASLAWLPWVVGSVMLAWQTGGCWIALAAVAGAMQVLTATPELTMLVWLFLGVLWVCESIFSKPSRWVSVCRFGSVIALAASLTMVQMLPFFDLITHSQRNSNNAEAAVWAMPGWGWANLLVPLFHCYKGPLGTWFQTGQEFLQSYYLGIGVLALGVTGAFTARSRRVAVVTFMILSCWVMALGADGFFYAQARRLIPFIGIARFPVKFAILPAFLLPLLATLGIDKILPRQNELPRRLFSLIAGAFILLQVALVWFLRAYPFPNDRWRETASGALGRAVILLGLAGGIWFLAKANSGRTRFAAQVVLLALLPLDAFTHSPQLVPTLPASVLAPGIWQADGRAPVKLGAGRVMLSPAAEAQMTYSRVTDFQADFIDKRLAEWYNLNLLDMLPKVTGAFTLRPAGFDLIEREIYYTAGSHYGAALLDFLSVQWISSPTNSLDWLARTNFLPVITAGQAPRFCASTAIWPAIAGDDFDPRAEVYLLDSERPFVAVSNRTDCAVKSAQFSNNEITADVSANAPSLVVLSQTDYHWWRATVDGQPVKLLKANLAFQALQVPAGTHHIKLVYRDPNLFIGAVISLLALAVCGGIWWRGRTLANQSRSEIPNENTQIVG